jgi:hypothetical protein
MQKAPAFQLKPNFRSPCQALAKLVSNPLAALELADPQSV